AVQGMRSNVYLQPGEKRACIGCHEPVNQAIPQKNVPLAGRRAASVPEPTVTEPGPLGYVRQIQPILDRNCVKCHCGDDTSSVVKNQIQTALAASSP
ncbi:MAG: hypothetical protein ACI4UF_01865, partial [Thermoguttaceae bacterium]